MAVQTRAASPAARQWPEQGQWTYQDWLQLPEDGTRYEVIDGVLYMTPPPSTSHQFVSHRLATLMTAHADANKLGVVLPAPVGVHLPNQPVPLQPDIVFISSARKNIIGTQYIDGAPDLVVEVLSPSNWPFDRQEKFQAYQAAGIPEYWVVDYRQLTIEVYALEKGEYLLLGKWGPSDEVSSRLMEGFQVAVGEVFKDI
jgi:Uma2 family endonuclease